MLVMYKLRLAGGAWNAFSVTHVQGTGKFLLCLIKHRITKTFGGEEAGFNIFLISAPDVEVRAGFRYGPMYSCKSNSLLICRKLCRHKIRSGGVEKRRISLPGIETRFLSLSPIPYSVYRLNYPTALY